MSEISFNVKDVEIGGAELFLISGPCVIEDEKTMMTVAEKLLKIRDRLGIGIVYKSSFIKDNRSSVDYYYGPGLEEGLRILEKIKAETGMPIVSDIHDAAQAAAAGDVLDIVQIPAYLCMQTSVLTAAGKTGKPVNIKHGQFLAPENMIKPAQKVASTGNNNIILTERGYSFGYNDLIVDPRSFYEMGKTGYPVVFDATHSIRKYGIPSADPSGGARHYLPVLTRSSVAAGIDGLFIETHPCPEEALCDAASQMNIDQLEEFLKPMLDIHATVK